MRLPLLLNARGTTRKSNISRIPPGRWRVLCSGFQDSRISLDVERAGTWESTDVDGAIEILGPVNVQVIFLVNGKEDSINVVAERISA